MEHINTFSRLENLRDSDTKLSLVSLTELSLEPNDRQNTDGLLSNRQKHTETLKLPELLIESFSPAFNPHRNPFENVKSITVNGNEGRQAVVLGLEAGANQSVLTMLATLHPELSKTDLDRALRQTLKYNKEFGNDLGDGALRPKDKVYLTSVKTFAQDGKVTSIRRPDGTFTKLNYDKEGQLSKFTTSSHSGILLESGSQPKQGKWTVEINGERKTPDNVSIDQDGNLTIQLSENETIKQLSNGTRIAVRLNDGKPKGIDGVLNDKKVFNITYHQEGNFVNEKTTYFSDSQAPIVQVKRLTLEDFSSYDPMAKDEQNEDARNLAKIAIRQAYNMNPTRITNSRGRCAEGVQIALAEAGMPQFLGCGHAWDMIEPLEKSEIFKRVSKNEVKEGDIMLRQSSSGYYGHIAIITGRNTNGQLEEASDHISTVDMQNPRYSQTVFLSMK